jgi:hypothetical protein
MDERELIDWPTDAEYAFDIVAGEFVVVTPDSADLEVHAPLKSLLRRVRRAFGIDAAFISEWASGEPVVRRLRGDDSRDAVECEGLHVAYATRLLESEAAVAAVPVITQDGIVHGTLCAACGDEHMEALHSVARLIAEWFDDADLSLSGLMPLQGQSVMGSLPMSLY